MAIRCIARLVRVYRTLAIIILLKEPECRRGAKTFSGPRWKGNLGGFDRSFTRTAADLTLAYRCPSEKKRLQPTPHASCTSWLFDGVHAMPVLPAYSLTFLCAASDKTDPVKHVVLDTVAMDTVLCDNGETRSSSGPLRCMPVRHCSISRPFKESQGRSSPESSHCEMRSIAILNFGNTTNAQPRPP